MQILLLMAADRAISSFLKPKKIPWLDRKSFMEKDALHLPAIPLSSFLKTLLGIDKYSAVKCIDRLEERIKPMYLRLIQFVQFFSIPNKVQLAQMFSRAGGIVCRTNAQYVDLIIPLMVIKENEKLKDAIVDPDQMSVLLIQVKCLSKCPSKAKRSKLCSTYLPRKGSTQPDLNESLDYVSLFVEVGGSRWNCDAFSREDIGLSADKKQLSLAVLGLRPSFILDSETPHVEAIDTSFDSLLRCFFNPLDIKGTDAEAKRHLETSISLLYQSS